MAEAASSSYRPVIFGNVLTENAIRERYSIHLNTESMGTREKVDIFALAEAIGEGTFDEDGGNCRRRMMLHAKGFAYEVAGIKSLKLAVTPSRAFMHDKIKDLMTPANGVEGFGLEAAEREALFGWMTASWLDMLMCHFSAILCTADALSCSLEDKMAITGRILDCARMAKAQAAAALQRYA
jgi:hypothetical protein